MRPIFQAELVNPTNLCIEVHEWDLDGRLARARFASRNGFVHEPLEDLAVTDWQLHVELQFKVRALALDHQEFVAAWRAVAHHEVVASQEHDDVRNHST